MAQDQSTDIFDQVDSAPTSSSPSGGDIFDQVQAAPQSAGPKAPVNPYVNTPAAPAPDDVLQGVLKQNPGMAKNFNPGNTSAIFASPERSTYGLKHNGELEYWPSTEKGTSDFPAPSPGKNTLEIYSDKLKSDPGALSQAIYGDLMHGMVNDPYWKGLRDQFMQSFTPQEIQRQKQGKTWWDDVNGSKQQFGPTYDAYIRGVLANDGDWQQGQAQSGNTMYSPSQLQILQKMRDYLKTGQVPQTPELRAGAAPSLWDRAKQAFEESTPGKNLALAGQYAKNTFDELHSLYRPIQGLKEIGSGADTLAGGPVTQSDILDPYHLGLSPQQEAAGAKRNPTISQMAKGATQVMGGTMEATKPLAAIGIAAAPFRAAAEYGAGILAGTGAAQVAKKMGATPDEQEFFHTLGFFIPGATVRAAGVHAAINPEVGRVVDPVTGEESTVNLRGAVAGGKGFAAGVAKGEPGQYQGAVRVGPFSARVNVGGGRVGVDVGRHEPGQPLFGASPEPPEPQAPPDPVATLASQQAATIKGAAERAAATEQQAENIVAGVPPPKPPSIPAPAGMDDGALTQDTITRLAHGIRMLPSEQQAPAVLEATGNLAKWLYDKRTVVGPDGKVISVETPKSAQSAAVKIVNDEVERQNQAEAQARQQQEQQATQAQQDAETARTEREESLEPKKGEKAALKVNIPDTPQTQRARSLLAALPDDATSARMDQHLRDNILLPTPVRKALVEEEVSKRAQAKETAAQEAMTGEPTPAGQKPEEIDRWVQGVKNGEEPFAHVQKDTTYRPRDTEGLARTKVEGAKDASGIYFHDPEISGAEIRKAAREGTLEQLRENWKANKDGASPTEASGAAAEEKPAEIETKAPEHEEPPPTPYEGIEGKHVQLHLADESSIPAVHRVVERSALTASHNGNTFAENPHYPQEIQERRYESSKPEQMKVIGQAQDFKPSLIVNTDPTALNGPLVVTNKPVTIDGKTYPAGLVLGGNSRKMTLDRLYTNGAETPYTTELQANHRSFGFPPEFLEEMREPVHVREIEPPKTLEDMHRLGSLLNKGLTQSLDPFDQAVSMGKQLSPDTLSGIADAIRAASQDDHTATLNSVLTDPRSGRQIVKMLERDGIITDRNRGNFVDPASLTLTAPARNQLSNALLANLLDTRKLMEETPAFLKQRLLGAIGSISAITAQDDRWNLAPALREAAKQYGELHRQTGMAPTEALKQQGMFGDARGPVIEALIKALDKNVAEVRKSLGLFSIGAEEGRNPSGMLVGISEKPDPYMDFNFAFGTELTKEQFDAEMEKLRAGAEKATDGIEQTKPTAASSQSETPAGAPVKAENPAEEPRKLAKGDKVIYTTNGGKERPGEIAFTDGRIARIKDAKTGTVITKKIADVRREEPETPEAAGAPPAEEPKHSLVEFLKGEIDGGGGPRNYAELKGLASLFDRAEPDQLRMKQVQEAYEAAIVDLSATTASMKRDARETFNILVRSYENQPNLSIRTSTSITNQAYSTPAPLAFIAGRLAGLKPGVSVYEPTAGNGMLLIDLGDSPKARAQAITNELNGERAENLKELGYKPTTNDATKWTPDVKVDAVVTNPPFGTLSGPVDFDGYKIAKLEHLIALKALSVMKDDGRAAIIIGASKEEPGEVTSTAKPFFNYLYSHYNVVSDFELDGDLYSRQGASWPVRVLAVDGRARSTKVCPPASSIERVSTWEGVYDKAREYLGANLEAERRANPESDGGVREGAAGPGAVSSPAGAGGGITHQGEPEASAPGPGDSLSGGLAGPIEHTGRVPTFGVGDPNNVVAADGDVAQSDRLAEDQPRERAVRRGAPKPDRDTGNAALADEEDGNQFQEPYSPFSEKKDTNVLAPKAMGYAMHRAMESLSDAVGDLDQFVADELGYSDVETMQDAFMGLQVDTIAAGIHAIRRGKAIIIADQTGIGKGRQAAAIIRWAELHGHIPIFVTAKAQLFTDMYGDLTDIGSGDTINPLLMNADATITHPVTEQKVFGNKGPMTPVLQRIQETGELPTGRNALFTTYSQVNKANRQQLVLQRLAPKAVFILDESHSAGGDSNTGHFFRGLLDRSKGAVYLSATYAKRPDNMPLYANKTDIGIAIPDKDKIVSAIMAGGAPLQAVVSNQLAQSGQLFRRERSFKGIDFPTIVATERKVQHEKISDQVTEILRAIVHADRLYHEIDFQDIKEEMEGLGMSAREGGNKASQTVNHMEFTSVVHNLVKQLLLGLKADDAADMIIRDIREDKKPIIALENTMGSFLNHYAEMNSLLPGAPLHNFGYGTVLQRSLDRTRYYNLTTEEGLKVRQEVPLARLSEPTRAAYEKAEALINRLRIDMPVSPIDWIRHRVEQAGFKIAEITGRDLRVDYSTDVPTLSRVPAVEKRDRVATALGFNNGGIDAMILNQAGSTGISLHASEKFRDQRTRKMYVVQPAADVNQFMQMLGRINRTGQVRLPEYALFAVDLPAETRPAMNLSKKMKSLNANTTSNTRSAVSVESPDMMNKYGDKVVQQYLAENHELAEALGMSAQDGGEEDDSAAEDTARKATGRSALLSVKAQREFMDAITEQYKDLITYLDETGQNDLEPKTYDFEAREIHRQTIYDGTDPSSPFGQDAEFGIYSIKRQGKPFTPEEVQAQIQEGLAGAKDDIARHRELAAEMDKGYEAFRAKHGDSPAILERASQTRQGGQAFMSTYRIGSGVRLEINGESYTAAVTNIEPSQKATGNPYALSSIKFTLAVNGPMRSIRVSGSELKKIVVMPLGARVNVKALFQEINPDARMKANIITGNLLGAYGALKGVKGRIINFSMADGTTRQGILLPAKFDPKENVVKEYAMRSAEGALMTAREYQGQGPALIAPDGDVTVSRSNNGGITIKTKMGKAVGGKFFLDHELLNLVEGGEFASKGGMMAADVRPEKAAQALKVVMSKIALYATGPMIDRARSFDEAVKSGKSESEPQKSTGSIKASVPSPAEKPAPAVDLDDKERAMLGHIRAQWTNSENLLHEMGENDAEFRQHSDAVARLVRKGLVEQKRNEEWGEDFRRTPAGTAALKQKPTIAQRLASEEGFADVQAAAEYASKAIPATWNEIVSATKQTGRSATKIGREIAAAIVPTYLATDKAKDIAFSATGEPALRIFQAAQLMRGIDQMFKNLPMEKWTHYVHLYQTGRPLPSIDMRNAFDLMSEMLKQQHMREEEAANLGRPASKRIELTWKENYFPNRYARVPKDETKLTEGEQIAKILGSRRPLEGSKAFMKKQTQTLQQAVDRGFIPLGNPVKMVLRRMQEGAKFVAANYMLYNGRQAGLVRFRRKGSKMPVGFRKVPDSFFKVWRPVELEEGGHAFIESGEWVLEDNFGRLIENYLSEDLIRGSEIGTQVVNLKALTTQFRLGFSPFHYLNMSIESVTSALQMGLDKAWNEGVRDLKASAFKEGITKAIKAPVSPFTVGSQMLSYARDPDGFMDTEQGQKFAEQYPDIPRIFMLGFKGGLRWEMPDTFKQSWGDGFTEAMKEGRMGAAFLRFAPWLGEALVKPLFQWYIPRMKWAYFAQLYSQQEAQYAQALAAGTITEETIAREVAATLDNRFGEFKFDSLFINNTLRTASQLLFTSPTWKYGTWRGLIDAIRESNPFSSKAFADRLADKIETDAGVGSGGSGNGSGGAGGNDGGADWLRSQTRRLPRLGLNAGWIVSKVVAMVAIGSVMTWLFTKKTPWQWAQEGSSSFPKPIAAILEAMHARTGWVSASGEPVRINFPSDLKDYERLAESPEDYVTGSLWSVPVSAYRTAVNRDWRSNYVFNPGDPAAKEFWQGLVFNFKNDFEPISASNFSQELGRKTPFDEKVARASGVLGGGPRALDQSSALRHALAEPPHVPLTPEQEEAYRLAQEQPPTRFQILRAAREKNLTYLERVFKDRLTYTQAKDVYDNYATPEERKTLWPIIERKRTLEIMRRTHMRR